MRNDEGPTRDAPWTRQQRRVPWPRWDIVLVIAGGGALGSLTRWGVGEALAGPRDGFPWATFVENISGGFALGALMVFIIDVWPPSRYVRPFLGVGVLGGYTTFSTYMADTRSLVLADRGALAAVYLFGTLAVGLLAVWLGMVLVRLLVTTANRRSRHRRPVQDRSDHIPRSHS